MRKAIAGLALCAALLAAAALRVEGTQPQPAECNPSCPKPGPKSLPLAAYKIRLDYDSNTARYFMQLAVGSNNQMTSLVVDTGSGSFYDAGYNVSQSTTAKESKIVGTFGYGSGPIGPVTFYRDSMSLPVSKFDGSDTSIDVKAFNWVGQVAEARAGGGLIGWSPPGWNQNAVPQTDPKLIAGSLCYDGKRACGNTPTAPQALLKAAKLSAMFSVNLNTDPTANGGKDAGEILMGGVDGSLANGPMIPTPLAPNLYRTDFKTGKTKYVFWQFTPLNVSLVMPNGTAITLCSEPDVTSPNACTAIVDTGYGSNVVADDAARAVAGAVTDENAGAGCAASLVAYIPTQKGGKAPVPLTVPLTQGGNCSTLTIKKTDWVPAPSKLLPNLPKNWFVWGQPMIRQLYVALSFDAYGSGGLLFAPRAV